MKTLAILVALFLANTLAANPSLIDSRQIPKWSPPGHKNEYVIYLEDIMKTIDTLTKNGVSNDALRTFITKKESQAAAFYHELTRFREDLRGKVRGLQKLVRSKSFDRGITRSQPDEPKLYESLWFEIVAPSKRMMTFEMWISAEGWRSETYFENDNTRKKQEKAFRYDDPLKEIANYCESVIQSAGR